MRFFTALASLLILACTCSAQFTENPDIVEFGEGPDLNPSAFWVGSNQNSNWTDTVNWLAGFPPFNDGTASVFIASPDDSFDERDITFDLTANIGTLIFDQRANLQIGSDFLLDSSLTIQNAVVAFNFEDSSEIYFNPSLSVFAGTDTDWLLDYAVELELAGPFHSSTSVYIEGEGSLLFTYDNSTTLSGEIILAGGTLGIANDQALGTAEIILAGLDSFGFSTYLEAVDGDRSISNNVRVTSGSLNIERDSDFPSESEFGGEENELNLQGTVIFETDTNINNNGGILSFEGTVSEDDAPSQLTINGSSPVIFDGLTTVTGGIIVQDGVVLFGDDDALPTAGTLVAEEFGYIGLIEETANQRDAALASFLALFDRSITAGTIGLDTSPESGVPNSYAGPIDLTGFSPQVSIGTVTFAEYTGTITPVGTNYRFGNGGGTLLLGSTLTDDGTTPRGLDVISRSNSSLTVYVNSSSNSFTGDVLAQNSAIIFGNAPGTIPGTAPAVDTLVQNAASTFAAIPGTSPSSPTFRFNESGYIGYQDSTMTPASFISHFDTTTTNGIIGFDSTDRNTNRVINEPIDLSGFTASSSEIYLGSSTWVNLNGTITLPSASTTYRFTGYKGGFLNVTTVLGGTKSVVVGDNEVPATGTFRSTLGESDSSVGLDAVNTYSGGTILESGQLVITNASSLGTGALTASGNTSASFFFFDEEGLPSLFPNASNINLGNAIVLNSWLDVQTPFGSTDSDLELSGVISETGGLLKSDTGTLTLSGDNTFSGGIFIDDGVLKIQTDTAAGTGAIGMNIDNIQQIYFNSAAPVIAGLYSSDDDDEFMSSSGGSVDLSGGTTLTISPDSGRYFDYAGSINGQGGLSINGLGFQRLSGFNSFSGGTTVSGGATLLVGNSNALGFPNIVFSTPAPGNEAAIEGPTNPSVTLDNGTLIIDSDIELFAEVDFGAAGGTIGGNGSLNFNNLLTFATDAQIAPGQSIGNFTLQGPVEFASGGKLDIELGSDGSGNIISDTLRLSTLNITATAIAPFTVFVSDVDGSVASNFDPTEFSTWNILGSTGGVTNFDIQAFALLLDSGISGVLSGGLFNLAIASGTIDGNLGTDNILQLQFSPVPEPSTFALLALGLTFLVFQTSRRRRV